MASEEDDDDEDEDGDGLLVTLLENATRRRFPSSEKKGERNLKDNLVTFFCDHAWNYGRGLDLG